MTLCRSYGRKEEENCLLYIPLLSCTETCSDVCDLKFYLLARLPLFLCLFVCLFVSFLFLYGPFFALEDNTPASNSW